MIDEDRTLQLFGYESIELSPHAHKEIVAVCEECGKYRVLRKDDYREICHPCSLKGERNPFFGKHHIEKSKQKMSKSHIGNPGCPGNKNGMFGRCGAASPAWKGGITPYRTRIWQTPMYKTWRKKVFERDHFTCQMCDTRGGRLEAHHIQPIVDNKNTLLTFDVKNGITLCKTCHASIRNHEYEFVDQFNKILEMEESGWLD